MLLTEKIYQRLFDEILRGKFAPGERFPTEFETAERFGVSRVTVRRAYGILERNGIILRRPRLGTTVNSRFSGSTDPIRMIAVLVPLEDTFARDFLQTLCRETAEKNILTVIEPGAGNGFELTKAAVRLASGGVRNMIFWAGDTSFEEDLFRRLRVLGVNLVFFDRIRPKDGVADYVGLDNADAVTALLDEAGRSAVTEVIFCGSGDDRFCTNQERREVFVRECERRHWKYSFFELPEDGAPAAETLRSVSRRLTPSAALICVNDAVALRMRDLTPGSCRLYSIDGTEAAVSRGISSYRQPMAEMAKACLDALGRQQRLGEKWKAGEYRFKGEIAGGS